MHHDDELSGGGRHVAQGSRSARGAIARIREEVEVAAIVADHHGLVTYVNERFVSVFGWSRREIVGGPITTIIPPGLRDAHNLGLSRFITTGQPTLLDRPLVLQAICKDGRTFAAEHRIVAERHDGEWVFGATIRPMQARAR